MKQMYFPNVIQRLQAEFAEVGKRHSLFYRELDSLTFRSDKGREYAYQGFARRLGIMRRCIENIYRVSPPSIDRKPDREELHDLDINLQAFVLNTYGSLDNLAWVWVKEKNILDRNHQPLPKQRIGFSEKYHDIRQSFSSEFQAYLMTQADWFAQLEDFRHALAHRIPLYVPPYELTQEETTRRQQLEESAWKALMQRQFEEHDRLRDEIEALGTFVPLMLHSYTEPAQNIAVFHDQIIGDWKVVMEIWEHFREELLH